MLLAAARGAMNRSFGRVAGLTVGWGCPPVERDEGDAAVGLAGELGGVAADPQAGGGGEQGLGAGAAGAAGVPGQRQAVDRVECGDAFAGHGAGAGLVALEGVVLPAHVAADVDGLAGDCDAVGGVAAGVVGPGGLGAGAAVGLPAGGGVAHGAGAGAAAEGAGGGDGEVRAVGGEVDVAHEGVEHAGAAGVVRGVVAVGGPGRDGGVAAGRGVHHGDLRAALPADGGEVADRDQLGAVRAHVEARRCWCRRRCRGR